MQRFLLRVAELLALLLRKHQCFTGTILDYNHSPALAPHFPMFNLQSTRTYMITSQRIIRHSITLHNNDTEALQGEEVNLDIQPSPICVVDVNEPLPAPDIVRCTVPRRET